MHHGNNLGTPTNRLTYDAAGRLKSVPGVITGITYNGRGQTKTNTYANGVVSTFTYDDRRGWPHLACPPPAGPRIQHVKAGQPAVLDLTYTRASTGRISQVAGNVASESWSYGYDELDQLLSATKEMLVTALSNYEGAMLFVSHDRHLLAALSNRVLKLTPDSIHQYGGAIPNTSPAAATRRPGSRVGWRRG